MGAKYGGGHPPPAASGPQLRTSDVLGGGGRPRGAGCVAKEFLFPPFSAFDARQGDWTRRKRWWLHLGIQSEIGRTSVCVKTPVDWRFGGNMFNGYVSVFDPVLCELMYRWFCPPEGQVVDPFAGGSVRGIVAGTLGLRYWGCDLRPEQIAANEKQASEIAPSARPEWVVGDAIDKVPTAPLADFVFSCPPYFDLERYSDDRRDLSTMAPREFLAAYRAVAAACVARTGRDRFLCFVVGDSRGPDGLLRDLPGETVRAFAAAGAGLYNAGIILVPLGSAPMRAARNFPKGRKLQGVHQQVLVFCKGDPKRAAEACGREAKPVRPPRHAPPSPLKPRQLVKPDTLNVLR